MNVVGRCMDVALPEYSADGSVQRQLVVSNATRTQRWSLGRKRIHVDAVFQESCPTARCSDNGDTVAERGLGELPMHYERVLRHVRPTSAEAQDARFVAVVEGRAGHGRL